MEKNSIFRQIFSCFFSFVNIFPYDSPLLKQKKTFRRCNLLQAFEYQAAERNRTADLRLTKATLYRLSQGSTSLTPIYYIVNIQNCQVKIKNFCGLQHEPSLVFTLLFPDCNSASRTRYIVRPGRRSYILFFQAAVFPCSYFRRAPTSLYRADSRCLSA